MGEVTVTTPPESGQSAGGTTPAMNHGSSSTTMQSEQSAGGKPTSSAPLAPSGHGHNAERPTSNPRSEQIDGQSATSAPQERKETHCTCADNSVGAMDASLFLCMKGGRICSEKTTASEQDSSPFLSWYFWVLILLIVGLFAVGTAYFYGVKPASRRKPGPRDLDFSPSGASSSDDEGQASDEEAQMKFTTAE